MLAHVSALLTHPTTIMAAPPISPMDKERASKWRSFIPPNTIWVDSNLQAVWQEQVPLVTEELSSLRVDQAIRGSFDNLRTQEGKVKEYGCGSYPAGSDVGYKERYIERHSMTTNGVEAGGVDEVDSAEVRAWLCQIPNWETIHLCADLRNLPSGEYIRPPKSQSSKAQGSGNNHIVGYWDMNALLQSLSTADKPKLIFSSERNGDGKVVWNKYEWVWSLGSHKIRHGSWLPEERYEVDGSQHESEMEAATSVQIFYQPGTTVPPTEMSAAVHQALLPLQAGWDAVDFEGFAGLNNAANDRFWMG